MVLLPCSKCCGPCWRCYRKTTLQTCNDYDFAFRVTVAEVVSEPSPPTGGATSPVIFDTSEETGIPIGAELLLSEPDWGSTCKWSLQYTAPEQIACRVDNAGNPIAPGLSNASVRLSLSADNPPIDGKLYLGLSPEPQDFTTFAGKPSGDWPWPTKNDNCSLIDYSQPWMNDAPPIFESGEYLWRVPLTYKTSGQPTPTRVGNIGFKIEVFSKGDIPEDAYEYQCFDAPPEEEGWSPVGKCFPTEEECAKQCPPPYDPGDDARPITRSTTGGRTMPIKTIGPGTHLKNMLAAWGIHAKKGGGCKCKDMEVKMNRLGIACKEPANLKMIVDHLQAEAKKRRLPFVRKAGEMLVLRAVKRFEKNS